MSRILQQTRGGKYAVAFVARNYNKTPTTRPIHNIKLLSLQKQLQQPAEEMLRLHGLRLHGPAVMPVGAARVQEKIDVSFYKATLQTIKLVHLHDTLHKPPVEELSLRGFCLHDHERYLQPKSQITLETLADLVSQSALDSMKDAQFNSIDPPEESVADMKISVQDTTTTTKNLSETPLMSTALLSEDVATLGQPMESMKWDYNCYPEESPQSSH
ncbi:hypothetical protein DSL72_006262 [Monilinia vaccinii-corymbosi]|uniref:Uncharacterized protein n=1 Tax=Monilinia vaccinii-corymbosi TaxID=61207 RepID=A0A8A3PNH8_9HELO|nr:hypothetical protein DSL72_006262 [Monilinia vaccinii-corymbosi]